MSVRFIIAVIGMAIFLEAIPYFLFPAKTKGALMSIAEIEPRSLRVIGFFMIVLSLLIVYASGYFR